MGDLPYGEPPQVQRIRINQVSGALEFTVDNGVTWTAAGGVSPSQLAVLNLLGSGWSVARAQFLLAKLPSLNAFNPIAPVLPARVSAFNTNDGAVEGGGLTAPTGATALIWGSSVLQHPKTGVYAVSFRAKCSPTSTDVNQVGVTNNGQTAGIAFSYAGTISSTKWLIRAGSASQATTLAADANLHDIDIVADGTNLNLYIDSNVTSQATLAQNNVAADEPLFANVLNTAASGRSVCTDFLVGFVRSST